MSMPPPPPGSDQPRPGFGSPPPPPPSYTPPPAYGGPTYAAQDYGSPPPAYQSSYQQGYGPSADYAGFGSRLGAMLIDGLIGALFSLPGIIALFAGPKEIRLCEIDDEQQLCELPTAAGWALFGVLLAAGIIAYYVILCRMLGRGQSWGMKATHIRLVGAQDGQPIGFGRALGRQLFGAFISGNVCALGYLWMLWDKRKQTWHDKIVNSVVVKT